MEKVLYDWSNPKVITRNCLKPRSYFVSYSNFEDAKNEANPQIFSLNGKYDFCYLTSFSDLNKNIKFKSKIDVPSCWQYKGFEKPFYVNNDYVFPFNPPSIPLSNPVGVYRKRFNFNKKENKCYVLTFLGSSACTVFLNNKDVGYFQGTHNMHEIDITNFVLNGQNEVVFVIYKWSDGSYLETQDMYRDNGIFRDVYINEYNNNFLYDFRISNTKLNNGNYLSNISLTYFNKKLTTDFVLYFNNEKLVSLTNVDLNSSFEINAKEWSAENPNIYTGYFLVRDKEKIVQVVKVNVGYKIISLSDGIFKINNVPVKLKGINYHESSFCDGFHVTKELFEKDVQIIKSLNINTIRFSHYPTHPYMLSLCEKYGLYVINEADVETYGCLNTSDKDFVSKSDIFSEQFIDRARHLFERDKNSPAIIMWSVGNESGIGKNLDLAYKYLKEVDPETPVQYETCFRGEYDEFYKTQKSRGYDVISVMYPCYEILDMYKNGSDKRPFYMCEYAHSMGLGPGGTQDYWDYIYSCDRCFGGCVWEYCDHANILGNIKKNPAKIKYLYGGDNGEFIHDGNFCADGIVLPDRRLSSSALEIKNIYRPFIFRRKENNIFIKNTLNFNDSKNYQFNVIYYVNGKLVSKEIKECYVEANKEIIFDQIHCNVDGELSIVIETIDNGNVVGTDNIISGEFTNNISMLPATIIDGKVVGDKYQCVFDKKNRNISSIVINGKEILSKKPINSGYSDFNKNIVGILPNIFRAPTDNDRPLKDEWFKQLYSNMWLSYDETEDNDNIFKQKGIFSPGKYEKMFDIESSYEFYKDGILLTYSIEAKRDLLPLGKFGVRFAINKNFNNVLWYGKGLRENYPDFNSGCPLSIYEDKAENLSEYYIKPQENGARGDIRYVRFVDKNGSGFQIESISSALSFSIHDYSLEDLTNAKHDFEIRRRNFYEVSIDGFIRGVGSQSCGLPPRKEYELQLKKGEKISFAFYLKPISK